MTLKQIDVLQEQIVTVENLLKAFRSESSIPVRIAIDDSIQLVEGLMDLSCEMSKAIHERGC